MSEKKMLLTYSGLKEREEELRHLKTVTRKEIAAKIKEAREKGDLSENAEYDAAKEEQAKYEARIAELERMLRQAVIIDEDELDKETVGVGATVTLFSGDYGDDTYIIVGSAEADPAGGKISNESPLGAALLGRRVGDEIVVDAPEGSVSYTVKEIS